ncbi:MAG TPA: alpha/beta hydrolase [Bacillales bacterium]
MKVYRISYGDNENQFGDLRLPEGEGPYPVAIVIHGGFWRARFSLGIMARFCEELTNGGLATWNIEYRRVGQEGGGWPGTLRDAAQATDYLRRIGSDYMLDLNRVVTIGHSAGGHLALWLGGRHQLPATSPFYSGNPLPLKGAVSLAGVNDLELMEEVHRIPVV